MIRLFVLIALLSYRRVTGGALAVTNKTLSLSVGCRYEAENHERRLKRLICENNDGISALQGIPPDESSRIGAIVFIGQTNLTTLRRRHLKDFRELKYLTIANSSLQFVDEGCFRDIRHLTTVDLSHNQIRSISWRTFSGRLSHHIKSLDLSGNPLVCGWKIAWLHNFDDLRLPITVSSNRSNISQTLNLQEIYSLPDIVNHDRLECEDGAGISRRVQRYQVKELTKYDIELSPSVMVASGNGNQTLDVTCRLRAASIDSVTPGALQLRRLSDRLDQIIERKPISRSGTTEIKADLGKVSVETMGIYVCEVQGPQLGEPSVSFCLVVVESVPRYAKVSQLPYTLSTHYLWYYVDVRGFPKPDLSINVSSQYRSDFDYIVPVDGIIDAFRGVWWIRVRSDLYGLEKFILCSCNKNGCAEKEVHFFGPLTDLGAKGSVAVSFKRRIPNTDEGGAGRYTETSRWITVLLVSFAIIALCILVGIGMKRRVFTKTTNRTPTPVGFLRNGEGQLPLSETSANTNSTLLGGRTDGCYSEDNGDSEKYLSLMTNNSRNNAYSPWISVSPELPVVDSEQLDLQSDLGEGAFGRVIYGRWRRDGEGTEEVEVAAKCMKEVTMELLRNFEQEALLLSKLDHACIVKFYGVSVTCSNVYLVFEFMDSGDLRTFLIAHGPNARMAGIEMEYQLTMKEMSKIADQVADGMIYLKSQHFLHRDLAARNCLVKKPLIVKLADFGMSRDVYTNDYYRIRNDTVLPLRWLAPESITLGRFASETDIWSYGVLLWEIFSYGTLPWCQYSNSEVLGVIRRGSKLSIPDECPSEMFELMLKCWHDDPGDRISLQEIKIALSATEFETD